MTDAIDWLPENLRAYLATGVIDFEDISVRSEAQTTNRNTLLEICRIIRDNGLVSGLEIGVLIGVSTSVLAAALRANGGKLIGVDPGRNGEKWGDTRLQEPFKLAEQLIALSGLKDTVTLVRDYSFNIFPTFGKAQFDFIYIDGDHNYYSVLADFIASDYCLAEGGYIVMDDVNKENAKKDWTDGGPARLLPMIFSSGRFEIRYLAANTVACRKLRSVA